MFNIILQLDAPPGFSKDSVDKGILGGNNGTRRIQIGLALFYLSVSKLVHTKSVRQYTLAISQDFLSLAWYDKKKRDAKKDAKNKIPLNAISRVESGYAPKVHKKKTCTNLTNKGVKLEVVTLKICEHCAHCETEEEEEEA